MSYAEQAAKVGRQPITIVEIDLDYCSLTFGTSPCTATGSGDAKCFNCFKTCQDTANFTKTTKTYKFCSDQAFLPIGDTYFPCITDVSISPTQLKLCGLSVDCSVTVTMQDFNHHDRGIDPYVEGRTYDPMERGTFFGKLLARNPFVQKRVMRVKEGYIDENRELHLQTRTYFIDRIEQPDARGRVKIYAKGLLRALAEGKQQAPAYLARCNGAVTGSNVDTTITVAFDASRGDLLGTSGLIRIEDEIIQYTARAGNVLTVPAASRGAFGTTRVSHADGTRIYQVKRWVGSTGVPGRLYSILYYLLVDCALIDASFIDLTAWETEYLANYTDNNFLGIMSLMLTAQKPVRDLVDEMLKTIGASLWWDEYEGELRFKVVTGDATGVTAWDDSIILQDSLSWKVLESEWYSQIGFHISLPIAGDEVPSPGSADASFYYINTDAEAATRNGNSVTYDVPTRWLNSETAFTEVANRILPIFSA